MKTIWKKQLNHISIQEIEIPVGSMMLTAREQYGQTCVWFLCDDDVELEKRVIIIVGTGINAPDNMEDYTYIGTAQIMGPGLLPEGPNDEEPPIAPSGLMLVYHVFEKKVVRQTQ